MTVSARARRQLSAALVVAAGVLIALGGLIWNSSANAVLIDVPVNGTPGRLVLAADPYPAQFLDLAPGEPAYWHVEARLEDADEATLAVQLEAAGDLATHLRGLHIAVQECAPDWSGLDAIASCVDSGRQVLAVTPMHNATTATPQFNLRPLTANVPVQLLIVLHVEDSAQARSDVTLMGLESSLGVGLTAVSIDGKPVVPRAPTLPPTGWDATALGGIVLLGAGVLVAGLALRLQRQGRR